MAIKTAATASAVVRPAINIIRRTRANKAAWAGVGSGATVSVMQGSLGLFVRTRHFFGTSFEQRPETGGHRRRRRGIGPARPRARHAPCGPVAIAAESADPGRPGRRQEPAGS